MHFRHPADSPPGRDRRGEKPPAVTVLLAFMRFPKAFIIGDEMDAERDKK